MLQIERIKISNEVSEVCTIVVHAKMVVVLLTCSLAKQTVKMISKFKILNGQLTEQNRSFICPTVVCLSVNFCCIYNCLFKMFSRWFFVNKATNITSTVLKLSDLATDVMT